MLSAAASPTPKTPANTPSFAHELDNIRSNPDAAASRMYREHRAIFVQWAKGWTELPEADLADAFQDSIVVFFQNIRSGRLAELTATPRTYLFGIGKNVLNSRLRSKRHITFPGEENLRFPTDFDPGAEQRWVKTEEEQKVQTALASLGEPCHRLLRLTFYEGQRSAAIAEEMGYASEEVVRTQRKRCLDKLRKLMPQKP